MVFYADLGDWLYVLLGLVWVFFSFYQKSKKRAAHHDTGKAAGENRKSILETFFQEFETKTETQYEPVSASFDSESNHREVISENYDTLESDFSYDEVFLEEEKQEKNIDAFEATKKELKASLKDNNYKILGVKKGLRTNRKRTDMRKAVVWSAILSRPDF